MRNVRIVAWFLLLVAINASPVLAGADLDIRITPPAVFYAGFTSKFSLEVTNLGPDTSNDIEVIVSASPDLEVGGCSETAPCTIESLESGSSPFIVDIGLPLTAGTFVVQASVSSSTSDPDHSNNAVELEFELELLPELNASAFSVGPRVDPGSVAIFVGHVGNSAKVAAHEVVLFIEPLDGSEVIESFDDRCFVERSDLLCHLGTMDARSTVRLEFTVRVQETNGGGPVRIGIRVMSAESDLDDSNNDFLSSTPTYRLIEVTTSEDDGAGSIRSAITSANSDCGDADFCKIVFRIPVLPGQAVQSIDLLSPLPEATATSLFIDGASQTRFGGETNPQGPEVEIRGAQVPAGNGLVLRSPCESRVSNLAINGFPENGLVIAPAKPCEVEAPFSRRIEGNYVGTDPSGKEPSPNALRGIVVEGNGPFTYPRLEIRSNVVSGNGRSGMFVTNGMPLVKDNLIGVSADGRHPIPNGASGIYVGSPARGTSIVSNVIAFNREFGVSLGDGIYWVDILGNSIHSNGLLGIDHGLDGVTVGPSHGTEGPTALIGVPVLDSAEYDPSTERTRVKGHLAPFGEHAASSGFLVSFYANSLPDDSGFGEGEEYLGFAQPASDAALDPIPFEFEIDRDLRGRWVTATTTRTDYLGFKTRDTTPETSAIDQGFNSSTSEFSRAIFVGGTRGRPVRRR